MFGFFCVFDIQVFSITDFRKILLQIRAYFIFLAKLTYCNATYVNFIDFNSKGQKYKSISLFFSKNNNIFLFTS